MHSRRQSLVWNLLALTTALLLIFQGPVQAQTARLKLTIVGVDDRNFPGLQALVSAFDAQGMALKGLTADSFKVTEDGKPVSGLKVSTVEASQPLAIVFVLDISSRMSGAPLIDANAALKPFLANLKAQDQTALVTSSEQVAVVQDFTADQVVMLDKISQLSAKGSSVLYDALFQAVRLLENRTEQKAILLLTNGLASDRSTFTITDVKDEALRLSIPIYPIAFSKTNQADFERLGGLTYGVSQLVDKDALPLPDALLNITDIFRHQYQLEFTSALQADGKEHSLEISLQSGADTATASRKFIARQGKVDVSFSGVQVGQTVGGVVSFSVIVNAPTEVQQVELSLDGASLASLGPPFKYDWDTASVTPGAHTVKAVAKDKIGNTGEAEISLILGPLIQVKLAINLDESSTARLSAQVDSLNKVAKVEFFSNDILLKSFSADPYTYDLDISKLKAGSYRIVARASDVNGASAEDGKQLDIKGSSDLDPIWLAGIVLLLAAAAIIIFTILWRRRLRKPTPLPEAYASGALPPEPGGEGASSAQPGPGGYSTSPIQTPSPYVLIEISGANPGKVWALSQAETRLGRNRTENHIPLHGRTASRRHAVIRRQGDIFYIVSLNPQNPVLVNGTPQVQFVLHSGDVIHAGDSELRFETHAR